MVLRFLLVAIFSLTLICPGQLPAADIAKTEIPATEAVTQAPAFPGLSELGSRSAALADFVSQATDKLRQFSELSKQYETLSGISDQYKKLSAEIKPLGDPDSWYVDRLTLYFNQFGQLRQDLDKLQELLTTRQQDVEKIRNQAQQEADYWGSWAEELKKQQLQMPQKTLYGVRQQLEKLDALLKKQFDQLLPLQEKTAALQRELLATSDSLTQALQKLRKATFRKNAHSFLSKDFYAQFSPDLWSQVKAGLNAAYQLDTTFFQDNGFEIVLALAVLVGIICLLYYYRKRFEQMDEWQFVLKHPFAAGSFVAVVLFWMWAPPLPTLLHFTTQLWAVVAATSMAASLVENRRQAWVLILAALVFQITSAFRMIALPQPLFRLYIAFLAVIFIPPLVQQVALSRKLRGAKEGRFFRALLRLAILVLAVSLIGQLAGYMNFSTWMIQATFATGMIILFARMALLLGNGVADILRNLMSHSSQLFFVHFSDDLAVHFNRLLRVVVIGFSFFYLLPVWRIFATINDAWSVLSQFGFDLGTVHVSLQMLGLAGLAFYLAIQISWLLQAMSETQFFLRRNIDRGVRDAIKKLIHYAVVLIGFMVALSFLGVRLQNFVVLLGAFGVGIGFGLQDIVNNFLSGLILLFERPIKVGDVVLIDGEYGTVSRIGLRSTVVQSLDESELIVPNSQMISQKVTNWTLSSRRVRLVIPVGVAYGSNLEKVLAILSEAAKEHVEVLDDPTPTPLFRQFGNSSLDFELRVWISNVDNRPRIQNELLLDIDRRFREEGIEIPFPQQDLHLRSVASGITFARSEE